MPPSSTADRNLLFGVLALQMDFIGRDTLISAMNAWVLDKQTSIGQILIAQGALAADQAFLIDSLVDARCRPLPEEDGSLRTTLEHLSRINDADIRSGVASLETTTIGPTRSHDPNRTVSLPPLTTTPNARRFRVLAMHAEGGLGQVFVARDLELDREVALKEIREKYADEPQSRDRFVLEAEITGNLEHPGIVPVYSLGRYPDGRPYYAMRLIRGETLHDGIARFHGKQDNKEGANDSQQDATDRVLAFRRLIGRFLDVCNAIAYAHSRGIPAPRPEAPEHHARHLR